LFSQAVYGSIVGVVTDPTGAAVSPAKVAVRDIDRDTTFSTVTNENGNYSFRHLIVGNYELRVEASGFRAFIQNGVSVAVDEEVGLDVNLTAGYLTKSVQVTGEAPLLKTERSDPSVTFNQRAVNQLPTFNRRFSDFTLLAPGVTLASGTQPSSLNSTESQNPMDSYRLNLN